MIPANIEIGLILIATAVACALPGVFLVLRRMALLSDAIGHVLLLGIVLAFFITRDLHSIWLVVGAALTGLATVALVETLKNSGYVKEDAAIGLVFPTLFSLGILLASLYLRNTHLDIDQVFFGIPELAPLNRFIVGVYDIGAHSLIVMAAMVLLNAAFIGIFFKELKLATFDAPLAAALGFLPGLLHYGLMGLVSLTAVTAFEAVGPVLIVAFMVVPAATAYLLTDRLSRMLLLSALLAAVGATLGTLVALRLDTNIAGTVSTMLGLQFGLTFVLAPQRGLIVQAIRRWRRHREFFETMLLIHLLQHEGTEAQIEESRVDRLHEHLRWKPRAVLEVVSRILRKKLVVQEISILQLTEVGRDRARRVIEVA